MTELTRVSMGALVPPTKSVEDVYVESQEVKRELWAARERLETQRRLGTALRRAVRAWVEYDAAPSAARNFLLARARKLSTEALG